MIYFSLRNQLKRLTLEERGMIFDAMLDYGELGVEPDFDDRSLLVIWDIIRGNINKDDKNYREKVLKNKYATYCRDVRKHGSEPLSFDDWKRDVESSDIA